MDGRARGQRTHREVADALRERIRSGELRPGQRMPTQAGLAEEFGVERGTIREALAILKAERLLTNVSRGAPATVAQRRDALGSGPAARPEPTMVALPPRVTAAFEAEHVRVDAVCHTLMSLTLAIGEPLRRIHSGESKPASVRVRALLPSRDIALAFPTPVEPDDADRVHRHWLGLRNAQAMILEHNLTALRRTHGIDVRVDFRALPFTPPVKLYVLNEAEALFAYYTISRGEQEIDHRSLETYEAEGATTLLFGFGQPGGGVRDGAFVEQSRRWFDALWETISTELSLRD